MNKTEPSHNTGSQRWIRQLLSIACISLLPVLTFFLVGPFFLYAGNYSEFESGFSDLFPILLTPAAISWLILSTAGLILRGMLRERYLSLMLVLGVVLWIQGNFLAGHYGVLDGRGIEWQAFEWPAWADIFLWLAAIVVALALYRKLSTLAVPVSLALIAVQLAAVTQVITSTEDDLWQVERLSTDQPPEGIYHYSTNHNIVHLVLDNFQTDIFEELVTELGLGKTFDGFTLFRETAAVAPYTSLAIPSIFQGRVYDGSLTPDAFFRAGMEDGFHSRLHDKGYRVNMSVLQPADGSRYDTHYLIPSFHAASAEAIARQETWLLLDVTLFRHAPHLARDWIYNGNNWRIQQWAGDAGVLPVSFAHKYFLRDYSQRIDPRLEQPAYHFIHLWPPHPPYVTTSTGQYAGKALPNMRENYKHEAHDVLRYTVDFFEALKSKGLYDDALILVHSDHGGAFEPEFTPTRMLSLMAIKPRHARGALNVSNAPASLADVAATILDLEGIELDWPGRPIHDIDEDEQRTRHYSVWYGDGNRRLRQVVIEGSLYSPESYTYTDPFEIERERQHYHPGETVEVGLRGTGSMYLERGWSTPDPGIVWNNGHEATIRLPLDPPSTDLMLTLWLIPAIYDDLLEQQRIVLYVGDDEIDRWQLDENRGTRLQTTIPVDLMQSGELELRFELPDAASQLDLGVGGDRRVQAIALRQFRLEEI